MDRGAWRATAHGIAKSWAQLSYLHFQSLIFHVFCWRNCGWEAVLSLSRLRELVMDREAWCAACSPWSWKEEDSTQQLNWVSVLDWGTGVLPSPACRGSSMDGWFLRFGEICFVEQVRPRIMKAAVLLLLIGNYSYVSKVLFQTVPTLPRAHSIFMGTQKSFPSYKVRIKK